MSQNAPTLEHFLARAERLLERLEPLLPPASPAPDWNAAAAFRWRKRGGVGFLQAIAQPAAIRLADLQDIDEQKARIVANTRQFLKKKPANNVLLTGARGSGKSSLIKALLNEYAPRGLRVIEVEKHDLIDLPAMALCGLAIAPANARPIVKERVHAITEASGGHGAVREAIEFILNAQGKLEAAFAPYLAAQ